MNIYIVISIIAILIVLVLVYDKPIDTPTVTTMTYSSRVLELYDEFITGTYLYLQDELKSSKELIKNIKTASDKDLQSFTIFPEVDKYKSLYLQFLELYVKILSMKQKRAPTSEEKSMILNYINQILIIQTQIPNFPDMNFSTTSART